MIKYDLILYSKTQNSLNYFLEFIQYNNKSKNFHVLKNLSKKKKTRKKISVLKSPHVNKTAQEQFEYVYYSLKISLYTWEIKKYLIFLKKIKNQLFPDLKIKIKAQFSKKKQTTKNKLLQIDQVSFHYPKLYDYHINKKIKTITSMQFFKTSGQLKNTLLYLKTLDCNGNIELNA